MSKNAEPTKQPIGQYSIAGMFSVMRLPPDVPSTIFLGKYLFPSIRTSERPMSDNTVNTALRRLGYDRDEMTGHGFRAMASTLLHELERFK